MSNETGRFTSHAGSYDAGRPTYLPEAVEAVFAGLAHPETMTVADLGSGTGISSRLLAERTAHVYGIEPNAAMRTKAGETPKITYVDASAERTGLPDGSVNLVTAFQAFHWFDPEPTFAEIVRILTPGGRAAAVYYERDESDPFTLGYGDVIRRFKTDETEQRRFNALDAFETWSGWKNVSRKVFSNEHVLDPGGIRDRIKATSYVPQTGPANEAMLAEFDKLFAVHARDGRVRQALQTIVVVATA